MATKAERTYGVVDEEMNITVSVFSLARCVCHTRNFIVSHTSIRLMIDPSQKSCGLDHGAGLLVEQNVSKR